MRTSSQGCFVNRTAVLRPTVIISALLISFAPIVLGQSNAPAAAPPILDKPLQFEVTSVKPSSIPRNMGVKVYPGGTIVFENVPLKVLIQFAFNVGGWQISGGEDWVGSANFDIEAKPPDDVRPPFKLGHWWYGFEDERLRQMLQALLIDRFGLKFHIETKSGTVYLLEKTDKPVKLVATKPPERVAPGDEGRGGIGRIGPEGATIWLVSNATTQQIADFTSNLVVNHPVLDKTGLKGHFDFHYQIVQTDPSVVANNDSSFIEAIEAMGLRLRRTTGPVETFLIEHAEKPSPN